MAGGVRNVAQHACPSTQLVKSEGKSRRCSARLWVRLVWAESKEQAQGGGTCQRQDGGRGGGLGVAARCLSSRRSRCLPPANLYLSTKCTLAALEGGSARGQEAEADRCLGFGVWGLMLG